MKIPAHPFLRGYVTAALWTTDPSPGSGEYQATPDRVARIPEDWEREAIADCDDFQQSNAEDLAEAGDAERNGTDFWLTRNGHGAGFWDRGYGDVGDRLTKAAKVYGSHDLFLGGWWEVEYRCKCGEHWTRPEDADAPDFGEDTCDACGAKCESVHRSTGCGGLVAIEEPTE